MNDGLNLVNVREQYVTERRTASKTNGPYAIAPQNPKTPLNIIINLSMNQLKSRLLRQKELQKNPYEEV